MDIVSKCLAFEIDVKSLHPLFCLLVKGERKREREKERKERKERKEKERKRIIKKKWIC